MLKFLALDRFTILLVGMVLLATFFPVSGQAAQYFNTLTTVAIAILFFLHGAKLSREAVIEGILHWKMHLLVFAITFFIFPAIGLLANRFLFLYLGRSSIGVFCLWVSCHLLFSLLLHLLQLQKGM